MAQIVHSENVGINEVVTLWASNQANGAEQSLRTPNEGDKVKNWVNQNTMKIDSRAGRGN